MFTEYTSTVSLNSVSLNAVSADCKRAISTQLKINDEVDKKIYFILDEISYKNESYIDEFGNINFFIAFSENENECIVVRDLTVTLLIKYTHECLCKETINETLDFLLCKKNKKLKLDNISYFLEPEEFKLTDDLGKKFINFEKTMELDVCKISDKLLQTEYKLVGTTYYAPYTKKSNIYCILYAELDNIFDQYAIKVLRWIPTRRDESNIKFLYAHELGYISKDENKLLHSEMVSRNNRILIGYVENSFLIKILGGYEVFNLDGCLKDFVLPCFISNYIK